MEPLIYSQLDRTCKWYLRGRAEGRRAGVLCLVGLNPDPVESDALSR